MAGKPEGKRTLGRARQRRTDNIKIDLFRDRIVLWTGLIWFRLGTGGQLL
jgi:hypothetical protein